MPWEGMGITRITLKMEELQKLVYEFEGTQMVTIEVARVKEPDTFGRTHTAYARVVMPQTKEEP